MQYGLKVFFVCVAVLVLGCSENVIKEAQAGGAPTPPPGFGPVENPTVVAPITWRPTYTPLTAFRGTDGRYHVQYQLLLNDVFPRSATIIGVRVVDTRTHQPTGDNRTVSDDGSDVAQKVRLFSTAGESHAVDFTDTMPSGGGGLMFFYLTYLNAGAVPSSIAHAFTTEQTNAAGATRDTATDAGMPVSPEKPLTISPTLLGPGWLDGNGSGPSIYEHRGTYQPANGVGKPDQAFAIDWIKLDAHGRTYAGNPLRNESFFAYGQPILSATSGRVVKADDEFPDQNSESIRAHHES